MENTQLFIFLARKRSYNTFIRSGFRSIDCIWFKGLEKASATNQDAEKQDCSFVADYIVFYPSFLASSGTHVDINTVIAHIDYIVNLVGIDYVAIGSDFDGISSTPNGLEYVSKFPDLTMALLEHGYSGSEVGKILGGNFMRVFQEVCDNELSLSSCSNLAEHESRR